jgi:hypothetical protein
MAHEHNCPRCGFRKKYDDNPKSLLGRLWRWHAGFCPGWKGYITSLPAEEREALAQRYGMTKYMNAG